MQRLRILWAAILFATVPYAVVLFIVAPTGALPEGPFGPALFGLALSLGVASQIAGRRLHARAVEQLDASSWQLDESPDPAQPGATFREAGPIRREARDRGALRDRAERLYQQPLVLSLGLADGAEVLGLLFGLLGGPKPIALAMVGLGALFVAALVPTAERVYGPVEAKLGVTLRDPGGAA